MNALTTNNLREREGAIAVAVFLMLVAPSTLVFAQSPSIVGVVSDGRGSGVSGATVTTMPQSGGPIRQTTSGPDGSYGFDGLPDDTYRVDFELPGFELVRRNHVRVRRGTAAQADASLTPRAICECVTLEPPSPWAQRRGQVVNKNGNPLPHARVEIVGREVMITDGEGRFLMRGPANEAWPLAATDSGFRPVTQQISGDDAASIVVILEYVGPTGVPGVQRFGGCECPGYLRRYEEH
jgi:hypothetical protein